MLRSLNTSTGIDDIPKGLETGSYNERNWQHFIQYTKDSDRLRDTDTFKYIPSYKLDKDLEKELR